MAAAISKTYIYAKKKNQKKFKRIFPFPLSCLQTAGQRESVLPSLQQLDYIMKTVLHMRSLKLRVKI